MTKLELDLTKEELTNVQKLMTKYGFEKPEDLFKFLTTIFAQGYVEFLWGKNKFEEDPYKWRTVEEK